MSVDTQSFIVSVDDVRSYARTSSEASQQLIPLAIRTVQASFNALVGYSILEKAYPDVRVSGAGRDLLLLPARNVTAVSKVSYLSGRSGDRMIWSELAKDLYEADPVHHLGVVGCGGFSFAQGVANWLVSFTAGWSEGAVPGDICEALLYEVRRWIEGRIDVTSENMGGQSSSGQSFRDITADTRLVLRNYALTAL